MEIQKNNTLDTPNHFRKKQVPNSINAWLIQFSSSPQYIALPQKSCHEIIESIDEPVTFPGIPRYGLGLIQWRKLWIPLIDFDSLVTGSPANAAKNHLTLVISYVASSGENHYIALAIPAYPQLITVSDDMICALPQGNFSWELFASSCLRFNNNRAPIINMQLIFTSVHS